MSRNPLREAIDGGSGSESESRSSVSKSSTDASRSRAQDEAVVTPTKQTNPSGASSERAGFVDTSFGPGGPESSVFKQEVDRRSTINPQMRRQIEGRGGLPKPYDAALLRDVSDHAVVQAYIDTLAHDVSSANWSITARDGDQEVDDEVRREVERDIEDIHPEKSFSDVLEQTVRNMLELGDATWVKHYYNGGDELAEAMPVDSARFYKSVDEHGITEGYLEASFSALDVTQEYEVENIVWFEWASRTDHKYAMGPTEKGLDVIMLLEELSEKEKKDLMEGMPSGVLSAKEDADNPLPVDEYENVKEDFKQEEGERHRVIVSRGEWDFTNFSGSYQELEVLKRNKYWVSVLGGVFKVNPSYAGFDFENTNRATDETQQEAYAQRGFRQTLQQVEEALNKQLIWTDYSEDLKFTFEREQTAGERQERVSLLSDAAAAAESWANMGREVEINEDGTIAVDPGTVTEEDIDTGGDDGGGFGEMFGSENASSREGRATGDSEADALTVADSDGSNDISRAVKADEILLSAHESQIQPKDYRTIEKRAWGGDFDVPEYVREAIETALDSGAVFENLKSVPQEVERILTDTLKDHLTSPGGWSLRGMVDDVSDRFPGVDEEALATVLRTETASTLNVAREQGYRERDDAAAEKFYWQGPDDQRTTPACDELKEETNPQYGGSPVSLNELIALQRDVQAKHFPSLSQFRKHVVHPNERHTFVRHVETPDYPDADALVDA